MRKFKTNGTRKNVYDLANNIGLEIEEKPNGYRILKGGKLIGIGEGATRAIELMTLYKRRMEAGKKE